VNTSSGATILLREPVPNSGWQFVSRRVTWNPSVLSVNGMTQPGYINLPATGNFTYPVLTLYAGYSVTQINHEVIWLDTITGDGIAQVVSIRAEEKKAVLRSVQFTSDHDVLRDNTRHLATGGDRYADVEFVRATKYNAPVSQSRDSATATAASKVKVKLVWDTTGIPNETNFKLIGDSIENVLKFESPVLSVSSPTMNYELTATNSLGKDIRYVSGEIVWYMVLNPGTVSETSLKMGISGRHYIYVTYGTPADSTNKSWLRPTTIRMALAVEKVGLAYQNGKKIVTPHDPKPARIVYETLQLHKFALENGIAQSNYPVGGWDVPHYWTNKFKSSALPEEEWTVGGDCISGAIFAALACSVVGIPGTIEAKEYMSKSPTEPTKAVPYTGDDPARRRNGQMGFDYLGHFDRGDHYNKFEAAVVYTTANENPNKTFYFPAGTTHKYDNVDDVLSIFAWFGWTVWSPDDTLPLKGKRVKSMAVGDKFAEWASAAQDVNID
jgi:hypothetical protein